MESPRMVASRHSLLLIILLSILPSNADETVIFSKFHSTVDLSCGIKKMDRTIAVVWRNEDSEIMTVSNDGPVDHTDGKSFELDPLTSSLKITDLSSITARQYKCEKTVKNEKTTLAYTVNAYEPVKCNFPLEKDLKENEEYLANVTLSFAGNSPKPTLTIGDRVVDGTELSDLTYEGMEILYTALSTDDGENMTFKYQLGENEEVCTKKLSILHPPKSVKIKADDVMEKGGSISCSSDGNPEANLEIKSGSKSLQKGVGMVEYKIPLDFEQSNVTVTCHASNRFSIDGGLSDSKSVTIITKAAVKSSATYAQSCARMFLAISTITTLLHNNL